jgi:hypothetical protein
MLGPTPVPTSNPTATIPPKTTPTQGPTSSPSSTATPSPTPSPTVITVTGMTDSGATVYIAISENITNFQVSNVTIASNQSAITTIVSFTVSGDSGNVGFSNITIPKTAILYGTSPVIFIDGHQATNQGYKQDANNFYVWYTTQFSTHQVKIQFEASSTTQAVSFGPELAVGITVPEIILVYTVVAVRRLKRKPDNA